MPSIVVLVAAMMAVLSERSDGGFPASPGPSGRHVALSPLASGDQVAWASALDGEIVSTACVETVDGRETTPDDERAEGRFASFSGDSGHRAGERLRCLLRLADRLDL